MNAKETGPCPWPLRFTPTSDLSVSHMQAPCAIFIGPFGPYVRDLMPGEPTDAELLLDDNAAKAYYQELWSRNDADFTKVASKVGRRRS